MVNYQVHYDPIYISTTLDKIENKNKMVVEKITEEDKKVWKYVREKVKPLWEDVAHPKFLKYVDIMGLEDVPLLEDLYVPHWRVQGIWGKSEDHVFFDRLSKGIFNINMRMRTWEERDYLPEPKLDHDTLHLPLLWDDEYQNIMRLFGIVGKLLYKSGDDFSKKMLKVLTSLYWHIIEFGLIEESNGEIYALGAGIFSSADELENAKKAIKNGDFMSLNMVKLYESEIITDTVQPSYFITKGLKEVEEMLIKIINQLV